MTSVSKFKYGKFGLTAAAFSTLLATSSVQAANGSPDFKINGVQANFSNMEIFAGTNYDLDYNGGYSDCTDVEWYITKPGMNEQHLSKYEDTSMKQFREGEYQLKITTEGTGDKRWFFNLFGCKNTSGIRTRTVSLNMDVPGKTQTKYPIMLIPGVFGYDRIELLNAAYFFGVGDRINQYSDQDVIDVSIDPWQDTEDRGAALASKIVNYMIEQDELTLDNKVNLIAHSHGTTTARMALHVLASELGESRVASLTSVAGPHYGTPTADGTQWGIENWDPDSPGGIFIHGLMWLMGDFSTGMLNLVTGEVNDVEDWLAEGIYDFNDYDIDGIYDVVADFTQKGMLRFNACYPSAGIAKVDDADSLYFIEQNLPDKLDKEVFDKPGNDKYQISKNSSGTQATVTIKDCRDFANIPANKDFGVQPTVVTTVNLGAKPDDVYGKGIPYKTEGQAVYGNGLGEGRDAGDRDAIRYFSFTGRSSEHWNTRLIPDVGDAGMALFLATHQLAGARTDESHFSSWFAGLAGNIVTNIFFETPLSQEGVVTDRITAGDSGYRDDSDSFIPVDSTRFGEFLHAYDKWNHMDEVNGFFGFVNANGAKPLTVYEDHANLLQASGL